MMRYFDPPMLFTDRREAGRVLADSLKRYRGRDVLVLGIPRGGVPVADEVARRLGADLDVVVARKLGAPVQPELAIGAVTANGGEFINEEIVRELEITDEDLRRVREEETREAKRREARFRGKRPGVTARGRIVLLVDDGLATGATMRAAVRSIRKQRPERLVVAVPVGSRQACDALRGEVDELVCPETPEPFGAVGYFYRHFEPTEDAEVQEILQGSAERLGARENTGVL